MKRVVKITAFVLMLSIITTSLCGCYDALDINKKHIVTAVLLDYIDGQVEFCVEIADIEGGDKDSGEKYKYVTGKGESIIESKETLNRSLDRQLYLSAIRSIIFTERFIDKYIIEYLNRLRASEQYNKKVLIATTSSQPQELIEKCEKNSISLGFTTEQLLSTLKKQGEGFVRTSEQVIEKLSQDRAAIILPSIAINDGTNELLGYTVIDENKVKGFIPANKASGCVLLNREKAKSHYVIEYNGQRLSVEGVIKDCKIQPEYRDEKINFTVDCEMKANLLYSDTRPEQAFSNKDYSEMEKQLKVSVKRDIEQTVEAAQNTFKCDYLYFDDAFRIKYPQQFARLWWDEEFIKADVDVKVKINLDSIWLIDYEDR